MCNNRRLWLSNRNYFDYLHFKMLLLVIMAYTKEKVELGGEKITIKKGALHAQLRTPADYKFSMAELKRLNKNMIGAKFKFKGKDFTMTPLLKKRITLGMNLMKK